MPENKSEIIFPEIWTEYGHKDLPGFGKYLVEELGDYLIPLDEAVSSKIVAVLQRFFRGRPFVFGNRTRPRTKDPAMRFGVPGTGGTISGAVSVCH